MNVSESPFLRVKAEGEMVGPLSVKPNTVVVSLAGSVTFLMTIVPGASILSSFAERSWLPPFVPSAWSTPTTLMWKGEPVMLAAPSPDPQSTAEAMWPVQPSRSVHPPAGQPDSDTLNANSRLLSPAAEPFCSTLPSLNDVDWEPVQFCPVETKVAVPPSAQTVMTSSAAVR